MVIVSGVLSLAVMSMNVTAVLKDGANRSMKRNGLMLMAILFVLSTLSGLLGAGIAQYAPNGELVTAAEPNALFVLPPLLAGVLSLVIGIASLVVSIAAVRVFVSDETEHLAREHFTRRMGWAALNVFVGAIVFGIVVGLGFVALVVPGIFLLVTLAFWTVFVAVEDRNFVEGFRDSWGLTKGHRLKLLALGLAVVLLAIVVNAVFSIGFVLGGVVGIVLAQVGSAIVSVFSTAALAAAYRQLTALDSEDAPRIEESVTPRDGARTA